MIFGVCSQVLPSSKERVIATPVESDLLYCLSLIDGKELWKSPRQNDLYVACADRDKVVLVGHRAVRALRSLCGSIRWGGVGSCLACAPVTDDPRPGTVLVLPQSRLCGRHPVD